MIDEDEMKYSYNNQKRYGSALNTQDSVEIDYIQVSLMVRPATFTHGYSSESLGGMSS